MVPGNHWLVTPTGSMATDAMTVLLRTSGIKSQSRKAMTATIKSTKAYGIRLP